MVELAIPELAPHRSRHVVGDFNETIPYDGHLLSQTTSLLCKLARDVNVHVLPADTHGTNERQTESFVMLRE